jgi:glycerophosphoryl diester phosphodiesterase
MADAVSEPLVCIGHRGAAGYEPENTLRSIRRALDLGAHGIEIDVQLVDGELVVFHDNRLERTTNGKGYLARQSFAELRALNAGLGEQIPTLREVCEVIRGRAFLNVELKSKGTAIPTIALLEELVASGKWMWSDFILSSFRLAELLTARKQGGSVVPIGLLLGRPTHFWRRTGRRLGVISVHPNIRWTSARMVQQAHAEGWRVFPYTVNTPIQLGRVRQVGVDGVFTDFPDRVLASGSGGETASPASG